MKLLANISKLFVKEIIIEKQCVPPEYIVFNVDNFNLWFQDPSNNAIYANKGIYLRMDKLSQTHITDYLDKCYGIKNNGAFLWSKSTNEMIYNFYNNITKNWMQQIKNL